MNTFLVFSWFDAVECQFFNAGSHLFAPAPQGRNGFGLLEHQNWMLRANAPGVASLPYFNNISRPFGPDSVVGTICRSGLQGAGEAHPGDIIGSPKHIALTQAETRPLVGLLFFARRKFSRPWKQSIRDA